MTNFLLCVGLCTDSALVDTLIVENLKEALHVLQACVTEEQRVQCTLLLRASAPLMVKRGDKTGMVMLRSHDSQSV